MPLITIKNHKTGATIYSDDCQSVGHALVRACADNVALDYADLRRMNLVNANLDGIILRHVRLEGANLMGANLSEAVLDSVHFMGASLQNTCLCSSSLKDCHFEGAFFGATAIAHAHIEGSVFAGLSTFTLDFCDAESLLGCRFIATNGEVCPFSRLPLVVRGMGPLIAILDEHIHIGDFVIRREECGVLGEDFFPLLDPELMSSGQFSEKNHSFLSAVVKMYAGAMPT